MASLVQIHDGIAERLSTIEGLRVHAHPPQGVTPPVAFVMMSQLDTETMGRADAVKTHTFNVIVGTSQSVRPQDGYRALIEYADVTSPKSVEMAIHNGNDFAAGAFAGLASTHVYVASFEVLGAEQMDAFEMYGGLFTLLVRTKGA